MSLAAVRSLDAPRRLATVEQLQEFEQELVDQYALAMVGAGITDGPVASERSTLFNFIAFLARPVWTAAPADADRYLSRLRKERHLTHATVRSKAQTIAQFFEFLIARYQRDITALTGVVVEQPGSTSGSARAAEVEARRPGWCRASTTSESCWFVHKISGLPEPMRNEMTVWFHALRDGSTTPPRMRARHIGTVRSSIWLVMPVLQAWTIDGHQSLREITRDEVMAALVATGRRTATLSRLRSLFRFLKASKLVFINPTARLRGEPVQSSEPLPIALDPVRQAINGPDPARAALAALIAFHALRNSQVRHLLLTDIRDGRMHVGDNSILLAEAARHRVSTWLAARARRWPETTNPYLFISSRTAVRTTPVSAAWIIDKLGVSPQKIREDRILNEAIATQGDVRRLADFFGIRVATAQRYVDVIAKPHEDALTANDDASMATGSRTQACN